MGRVNYWSARKWDLQSLLEQASLRASAQMLFARDGCLASWKSEPKFSGEVGE